MVEIFGILNVRLEAIRRRHDELEPMDDSVDDDLFSPDPRRGTMCSTRAVKEAPYGMDEITNRGYKSDSSDDGETELERVQTTLLADVQELPEDDQTDRIHDFGRGVTGWEEGMEPVQRPGPRKSGGLKDVPSVSKVVSWLKVATMGKGRGSKLRPSVPDLVIDPFVIDPARPASIDSGDSTVEAPSVDTATPDTSWEMAPKPTSDPPISSPDRRSVTRHADTSAFFAFEFETGLSPRSDVDPNLFSRPKSSTASSTLSGDQRPTSVPLTPTRRNRDTFSTTTSSPRVSLRFSKRASILPPSALDVLKECGEAVPPIPAQYRSSFQTNVYDKRLHPYAVRGLRDYEDA